MSPSAQVERASGTQPGKSVTRRTGSKVASVQRRMERDMADQVDWLAQWASARGYAGLEDLFGKAPKVYMRLAARWRQSHPLRTMA